MAHFRAFFSSDEWLTASDLYNERDDNFIELDVEITKVTKGTLTTPGKNDAKKSRPALHLMSLRSGRPVPKPLGAGATICETIASIAGTGEMKRWVGQVITLFVTETKVSGKTRPCIRVKPHAPPRGQSQQRDRDAKPENVQTSAPTDDGSKPVDADEARLIAEQEAKERNR